MSRWWLAAAGGSALLLGGVAALVFGLALLDPAGAQAANDADPFGTPPSTASALAGLAIAAAMKICGVVLVILAHRERDPHKGVPAAFTSRRPRKLWR
jgi:hypothetical protein